MADTLVLCGGAPRPARSRTKSVLELDVSPKGVPSHRLTLDLSAVVAHFLDNIPDVLSDLLEVAAYVLTADRLLTRGTTSMARMGAAWRRDLRFRIPVRCVELWSDKEVSAGLIEALEAVSEDYFSFDFIPTLRGSVSPYIGFDDPDARTVKPDEVILFSGGLDSTTGAADKLLGAGRTIALATVKSAKLLAGRQDDLVQRFQDRVGKRNVVYVPIWVRKGPEEPTEHTQRTRSFLFASWALLVAHMFEKDRFFFFENGVTTFNLPVADHVLGARASRTTHPRVLKAFEQLFSLLLRRPIKIHNPYIWRTKAGVLATLSALGAMDLLPHTVSCASVRSISMRNKQCGVCSQCVERRFAVGAAGLSDHEPADFYHTDMFRGAHEDPRDLMMAECHVLRARKLAGMSDQAMLSAYGEIFRAVPFLPGSPDEIARAICDLHRRYGREVITVLDLELRKSSSLEQSLELPATSLLAMIRAPIGIQPHLDPTETEPSVATQAEADTSSVPRHQFILGLDYKSRAVFFLDGPRLGGASFELIRVLVEQAEKADAAGLPRIQTGYLSVPALQDLFDVDAETLRKRVAFTRQKLREHFLGRRDFPIDEQDIIESRQRLGYRLNPHVLVVDVAQIRNGRGSHESSE